MEKKIKIFFRKIGFTFVKKNWKPIMHIQSDMACIMGGHKRAISRKEGGGGAAQRPRSVSKLDIIHFGGFGDFSKPSRGSIGPIL